MALEFQVLNSFMNSDTVRQNVDEKVILQMKSSGDWIKFVANRCILVSAGNVYADMR